MSPIRLSSALFLAVALTACSPSDEEVVTEDVKNSAAEAERRAQAREGRERYLNAKVAALRAASDGVLKKILLDCRSMILDRARSNSNMGFEPILVDQFVADVYQSAAMGSPSVMQTDAERIQRLRENLEKDISKLELADLSFNTTYMVIVTNDSFNGPRKASKRYMCDLSEDLSISGIY